MNMLPPLTSDDFLNKNNNTFRCKIMSAAKCIDNIPFPI
ncbi:MAG: hypothetical protein QG657_1713 [Acidobacteriota bacterium]|nr:hypothetical protein [Acidobacteriota bacterium]